MSKPEVNVQLPKFKLEKEFRLTRALGLMGMPDAFCPTANLTGISASGGLYISEVVHKAFVEVDEKGTEAAAATGGFVVFGLDKAPPKIFFATHPFLFAIRDNGTGSILFMGRITDPTR
jgi:serpin B